MPGRLFVYIQSVCLLLLISGAPVVLQAQDTGSVKMPPSSRNDKNRTHHQSQDTLAEIKITASRQKRSKDVRNQFTSGQQTDHFDAALLNYYRSRNIAALITEQSPVFVKTYGVNNMATLSIRGASAAQSEVLWNGVPINNAGLGVSDVSLLQAGMFDDISIQYGGSSALFGSGNVGGALLLEDKIPDFQPDKNISVTLGTGSFGRLDGLLEADKESNHWHFGMKAFWEQAKNNFSYQSNNGNWFDMTNAALKGGGGIFNADYLFPKRGSNSNILKQDLSIKVWYQQSYREIPPALFESVSVKQQEDKAFHSLVQWDQQRKRSYYYGKIAFSNEFLSYRDGVVLPNNENRTNQWYAEMGWKWWINNPLEAKKWLHELLVFFPVEWASVSGENLNGSEAEFRPAAVVAYKLQSVNDRLQTNFSLRREWRNGRNASWLPGWSGKCQLLQTSSLKNYFSVSLLVNVQKSYRVPNINELYFSPGGNPDLKPEQGWSEDAGISLKLQLNKNKDFPEYYSWQFTNQTSFFNRDIKDWIYWLGGAIWTPHNLAAVHSRGVETEMNISWHSHRQLKISLGAKTAYVLATTTDSYLPNDNSIGSQIPYTPRYNGIGNISISWKGIFLNYNHQYTGYRFITTDESQFLKPYQVGSLQFSYTFPKNQYSFSIMGQVRNLWDAHFEVVNGRPMPGRSFLVSLRVGLDSRK